MCSMKQDFATSSAFASTALGGMACQMTSRMTSDSICHAGSRRPMEAEDSQSSAVLLNVPALIRQRSSSSQYPASGQQVSRRSTH